MKKKLIKEKFTQKCLERGLKITPQRSLIFEELSQAKDHPTAEGIYKRVRKRMPNISFDTVYRTLLLFTEIGLISQVEGYGEQKRFEPNEHHHHHCRCIKCHAIIDFCHASYDSLQVPAKLAKEFHVLNKRVVLEGICAKCSKK